MNKLTSFFFLAAPLLTYHGVDADSLSNFLQERGTGFEWTAWGDSYASGVGSGDYINGRRCLRYSGAYPQYIQDQPLLISAGGKFNNVVCSGAEAEDIINYQLYDEDQFLGKPNAQYYPRPASGSPTMGSLTMGGDDIDFPGILNNCIVDKFPVPLSIGFRGKQRTCDQQRTLSWSLIAQDGDHDTPNEALISKIDSVIKAIVNYGQGARGNFRLYVTGYGEFFNDKDPGCNTVTFSREANDGKEHPMMTTELRQDFNAMTDTLNLAIQQAVSQNSENNVKYIDINSLVVDGHRFCEPGIQEPDQSNPNLWFWHYPYGIDDSANPTVEYLNSVQQANINNLTWDANSTLWSDYLDDFWSLVDEGQLNATADNASASYNIWPDTIGTRAKVFHPQVAFHEAIFQAIWEQYIKDTVPDTNSVSSSVAPPTSTVAPTPSPTPTPPAYATGSCCFHLDEFEDCAVESDDLYEEITLLDNDKNVIYQTPDGDIQNGMGDPINDGNGTTVQGPLPYPLAITGEHENDYIQFYYGDISWTSREPNDGAQCTVGGWDPRDGPECWGSYTIQKTENQMDCCFPC